MPIVGPLREFGVQDVFQLLALSRKTGLLTLTAPARSAAGFVVFDTGRVAHAGLGAEPFPVEDVVVATGRVTTLDVEYARRLVADRADTASPLDVLIEGGAITAREVERALRHHVEFAVFELMTWRDGTFSFEELSGSALPRGGLALSAESLLMESARRIDEWSRLAQRVPDASAVATLVPAEDSPDSRIDLRPNEWLVLGMIDGARDVRTIAATIGEPVFDVAKIVYGLVITGLVAVRPVGGHA